MANRPKYLKIKVWESQGKHCYWCECLTIIHEHVPDQDVPDNAATIDHVYPVWHPKRKEYKARQTPSPFVIACRRCNNKRGGTSFQKYHELIGKPFNEPKAPKPAKVRRVFSQVRVKGFGRRRH